MKLIVQKYGGTSVGTVERIKAVAQRVKSTVEQGKSVVVVVSAMGKSTDELVSMAHEITGRPDKREMDVLLSTGEQISISLLAMALHEIGIEAISFTGAQIKILTDNNFSNARIRSISTKRINSALERNKVVIVAGFQGIDEEDNITTLGRGGSDTSAVALATVLNTRDCEIYTDVDAVYTADPRVVANPKRLNEISYEEMLELSRLGASVLHSRSVEFAKKNNIRLHVRSSFSEKEGTIVMPREEMMEKFVISGVTAKHDEAQINLRGLPDKPGVAAGIFKLLGEHKIYVNMIVQSKGHDNHANISFTVLKADLDQTMEIMNSLQSDLDLATFECKKDVSIVSAVGVGMLSSYGVAGEIFQVLADQSINIEMISTSEIGVSCVIDSMYTELALKLIHKNFIEKED